MRFLHTADWHIGKKLHGYDLLADQKDSIQQIIAIAEAEQVDAIVIAGDLYDRSVPAVEAVELLNQSLIEINLDKKMPLLAISGNHDSSSRLATGAPWFQQTDFHLVTQLKQAFEPVTIGDTQFFLLPYIEPIAARLYFDEEFPSIKEAVQRIIAEMQPLFDPTKKHVLITHFFIAGGLRTESETPLEVGGLNSVPYELMAPFDYVALGHLHSKNALKEGPVRYSGSPLKFSLSEINDEKGVWIVDSDTMLPEFRPLTPLRDIKKIQASFADLLHPDFYQNLDREAFWQLLLTDRAVIPNMMNQLRAVYPYILSVERVNGRESQPMQQFKKREASPQKVFATFFEEITGDTLTERQQDWLDKGLQIAMDTEKRD
ncbi:exonuclease SbcCD subunit D [Enterococcus saccharolyticus]|uniref:Nuclease SbcCD subunit D n=1 Tax=Candidatus Enterococcus willemsii TaxID=1857215 RepID=A0ABQ6YWM6_9ENTE|nr:MULTISPECIES: exonuclease SbcCD subunit D [Enterococcus]KAF1302088.1 exonuclease sbcCD subunit D [Enterococcus sp. CU12B]MCD5002805.1 exonuclease SbcCD subunit D [Enterococcus saccharolyticus]